MNEPAELPLWDKLKMAQETPELADVRALLNQMEGTIAKLPESMQLQRAGEALLQLAELCAARAEVLITDWEEAYRDPIVEQGFFAEIVRQTMAVDLSELMEPDPPRKLRTSSRKQPQGTVVAPVEKTALLAMLEQWEQETAAQTQQVLAVAHDENVSGWIAAIAQELQAASTEQADFAQLCQSLGMARVEVWLGVLLGGFELRQAGEFYSNTLWVKCVSVDF